MNSQSSEELVKYALKSNQLIDDMCNLVVDFLKNVDPDAQSAMIAMVMTALSTVCARIFFAIRSDKDKDNKLLLRDFSESIEKLHSFYLRNTSKKNPH